jgi:hypothetical protein
MGGESYGKLGVTSRAQALALLAAALEAPDAHR